MEQHLEESAPKLSYLNSNDTYFHKKTIREKWIHFARLARSCCNDQENLQHPMEYQNTFVTSEPGPSYSNGCLHNSHVVTDEAISDNNITFDEESSTSVTFNGHFDAEISVVSRSHLESSDSKYCTNIDYK